MRVTARYIPPGAGYKELKTECADFFFFIILIIRILSELGPRRVSNTPQSANERLVKLS